MLVFKKTCLILTCIKVYSIKLQTNKSENNTIKHQPRAKIGQEESIIFVYYLNYDHPGHWVHLFKLGVLNRFSGSLQNRGIA